MKTLSQPTHSRVAKSCGCGSPTSGSKSCSCGQPSCEDCAAPSFVRPRFFAGQLLTEDDLALLGEYVAGKNRLHNRHLFGDGVVCGLDVECHPCADGRVVVQPGYALDCCGNDVVVPCETTLDVNAMVRHLRLEQLGHDCGDPCDSKAEGQHKQELLQDESQKTREYCLYLYYCERHTDPVAPYSTDEPCGHQTCQPSRTREGYRFELRCRERDQPYNDLLAQICACLGDLQSTSRTLQLASSLVSRAATIEKALLAQALIEGAPAATPIETTNLLSARTTQLTQLLAVQPLAVAPIVELVRSQLQAIAQLVRRGTSDTPAMTEALTAADSARTTISDGDLQAACPSKVEHERARAILDLAAEWKSAASRTSTAIRLMAEGEVMTRAIWLEIRNTLVELRDWLSLKLQCSSAHHDCLLRLDDERVQLPQVRPDKPSEPEIKLLNDATMGTVRDICRYLLDCFCDALNPPCRSCEDLGVLLACVTVRNCTVIKVCALDRRWVMSGTAFRYWLPFERLGRALGILCCAPGPCPPGQGGTQPGSLAPQTLATPVEALKLAGVEENNAVALVSIGSSLSALANGCGLRDRIPRMLKALVGPPGARHD